MVIFFGCAAWRELQGSRDIDVLLELVSCRYEHRSLPITTNLVFNHWEMAFPNASYTVAVVNCFTHRVAILVLEGQRCRRREAEIT